ncbi:YcgN family cysteine cluster protein [Sphingomonas sp.]|uniref:YcgN family cysteine cluster protein n=1 Tax=Sphingomonas sp. TaxID=28214 RepID=UPI0035BC850B
MTAVGGSGRFWEDVPIEKLDRGQWEALCDGCGKCCIHKLEDEETGELLATNVACRLLDRRSGQCSDYKHRRAYVPECVRLTPRNVLGGIDWLPSTCAYRLRAAGEALPDWHYLVCGDRDAVHRAGISVRGWTISEDDAGDLEHHLVDREL